MANATSAVFRARMNAAVTLFPAMEGLRLLDLGSGSGVYSAEAFRRGASAVSTDLSTSYLKKAARLIKSQGFSAIPISADAAQLPFKDGVFDVVVALEVIEHVVNPEQVLAEIVRVLGPKGVLIVSYPQALSPMEVASQAYHRLRRLSGAAISTERFHQHLHYFTDDDFGSILTPHGFQISGKRRACVLHPLLIPFLAATKWPYEVQIAMDRRFGAGPLGTLAWCTVLRFDRE